MYILSRRFQADDIIAKHCVFFAALENQYDTIDRISGNQIVANNVVANMMTWDNGMNMYRFRNQGRGTTYAASCVNLNIKITNNGYAMLYDLIIPINNAVAANGFGSYSGIALHNLPGMQIGILKKLAIVFTPRMIEYGGLRAINFYFDGVLTLSNKYDSDLLANSLNTITFIHGNSATYNNGDCCQKNFMIFNKMLTVDEIKKIQKI